MRKMKSFIWFWLMDRREGLSGTGGKGEKGGTRACAGGRPEGGRACRPAGYYVIGRSPHTEGVVGITEGRRAVLRGINYRLIG